MAVVQAIQRGLKREDALVNEAVEDELKTGKSRNDTSALLAI